MDVQVGDILVMKKEHPCGAKQWLVLRSGMDFRLRCTGCGHELMLPRSKAEKSIRQIVRDGKQICHYKENMTNDRPQFRLELRPLFLPLRRMLLKHGQTGEEECR